MPALLVYRCVTSGKVPNPSEAPCSVLVRDVTTVPGVVIGRKDIAARV